MTQDPPLYSAARVPSGAEIRAERFCEAFTEGSRTDDADGPYVCWVAVKEDGALCGLGDTPEEAETEAQIVMGKVGVELYEATAAVRYWVEEHGWDSPNVHKSLGRTDWGDYFLKEAP